MFRQFGWMELLVVLLIALFIFGPSKLPQLAKSIGRAIREFRASLSGEEEKPAQPAENKEEQGS